MTAEEYVELRLARGARARKVPDGFMVTCPAHADVNPSLHVTEGRDGRVLLSCQAGCETADVLAADDLAFGDLYPGNGRVEVAAYAYRDERGQVLFEQVRFEPKDFRLRRPDGRWGVKGITLVPYHLPELLAGIEAGKPVFVVEGEKDVHALERAGCVATCNPMGAGKWRGEYAAYFEGHDDVRVIADRDEPGRRHAAQVIRSLKGKAAVRLYEPAEGKDAADHLAAGRAPDEFVERDAPAARALATEPLEDMRQALAEVLGIADEGVAVEQVDVWGAGPRAAVDVHLSSGDVLHADHFGDLASPNKLAALIVTTTGIVPPALKGPQAMRAVALVRRIAQLHEAITQVDIATDYGVEFLQRAPIEDVDLADQAARFRAFVRLADLSPERLVAQGKAPDIAAASIVLVGTDGTRHVHCGHFASYVRHTYEGAAPGDLAGRMRQAGWTRRGKRGQWRARAIGRETTIRLPLWQVPAGWPDEDGADDQG